MKIIFNRLDMMNAITPLLCAVGGKSTFTSVNCILFEVTAPNICTLTSYDLEKGVRISVNVEVEEEGSYAIEANKFYQTLKLFDGDEISLTVAKNRAVTLECGSSVFSMTAIEGEDFPEIPRLTSDNEFSLRQSVLKNMLGKVLFSMAVNDNRPFLNGAHMKIEGQRMTLVSCDSFRLSKISANVEILDQSGASQDVNIQYVIPNKTVNELYRQLSDREESTVQVITTKKNIIFNLNGYTFFSKLIDSQYMDYDRMIIKNHTIHITVDKEMLCSALDRASIVTEEKIAGTNHAFVKLTAEGDTLKISAISDVSSLNDAVPIEKEGNDLTISFNNKYLQEVIRSCDGEKVRISMTGKLLGINVEPAESDMEQICMILPVRTPD